MNILYRYWEYIAIALLIGVCWLLFNWATSERLQKKEAIKGRDAAVMIGNGWKAQSTTYQNKQGETITQVKAIELDRANIEALAKSKELAWLKKFEGLKKDYRNLQSAQAFDISFMPENVPRDTIYLPCKDSVKTIHYVLKDQWNDIDIKAIDTPRVQIRDRVLAVVTYGRPKAWFWKLQWSRFETKGEATNSNKLVKIDSSILIVQKRK